MKKAFLKAKAQISPDVLREADLARKTLSADLTEIPQEEIQMVQALTGHADYYTPIKAWRSKKYIAMLYRTVSAQYPGMLRLTVQSSRLRADGKYDDGLTWDELHKIKAAVGFMDWYAVEIYPPIVDVVNDCNMRHLWLLPEPLAIGMVGPEGWHNQS